MDSAVTLEQVHALEDAPEIQKTVNGPLVSPEIVVVANLPLRTTGTDANVQIRGVSLRALEVHKGIRMQEGQFFRPSSFELVVGKHASTAYAGLTLGSKIRLGGTDWTVVGVMDAGGSSFDSEIWCDSTLLAPVYHRPLNIYQSAAARLVDIGAFDALQARMAKDPRLQLQVQREKEYYAKASQMLTTLITTLGLLVAAIMGVGAVFAALNTMYSAVAERSREIATIRALGFSTTAVIVSFLFEALVIAFVGGVVGAVGALPLNGLTTSTMSFQTFSHVTFAFLITPGLMAMGVGFALLMGIVGGLPPAYRAARLPITTALRDL
jgi:putative ABC transport system permease protein